MHYLSRAAGSSVRYKSRFWSIWSVVEGQEGGIIAFCLASFYCHISVSSPVRVEVDNLPFGDCGKITMKCTTQHIPG